jgi:hypothetical protein
METTETTIAQQENGGVVSMSHQPPCSPFKLSAERDSVQADVGERMNP